MGFTFLKTQIRKDVDFLMSSKQTVKEMFNSVKNSGLHKYASGEKPSSRISDENILTAFQMIDAHTTILRDQSIIGNLDRVVNIISTVILTSHSSECIKSEEKYVELVNSYLPMFIDEVINGNDDEKKSASDNVKGYVIYSCLVYYATKMKDAELLKRSMSKIAQYIGSVIKKVNEDYAKHQQEMLKKAEEHPKSEIITSI